MSAMAGVSEIGYEFDLARLRRLTMHDDYDDGFDLDDYLHI